MTNLGQRRRFVGVNVEAGIWDENSKIWPHLGLTYIGTIAQQEGFDVVLHDELIEGTAPLEKLIEPGDIVGLSLLTTGIDAGVERAKLAKQLGARLVIAGNDSAMFRAPELLARANGAIDAVFTSNSLKSVRQFFHQNGDLNGLNYTLLPGQSIPLISNSPANIAAERDAFDDDDFFMIPDLSLYRSWDKVWRGYRNQFGHKHVDPVNVRNGIALFAQGCVRAGMGKICRYCTIRHVANVLVPCEHYLAETLEAYDRFGLDAIFNATDDAFGMGALARRLASAGRVKSLVIYGRSQAMAQAPQAFDVWQTFATERLLVNCGMDSADERILQLGIEKSSSKTGSRVAENRQAVRNVKAAGPNVHLHFSLIFGNPGETEDSCKANVEFCQWAMDTLGPQLDVVEGDIFWLNFGSPAGEIFHNYDEAVYLASLAGKSISRREWYRSFAQYAGELSVPMQCEKAWYQYFTNIDYDLAREYNATVKAMMDKHEGGVAGREFAFKPPPQGG